MLIFRDVIRASDKVSCDLIFNNLTYSTFAVFQKACVYNMRLDAVKKMKRSHKHEHKCVFLTTYQIQKCGVASTASIFTSLCLICSKAFREDKL